MESFFFIFRLKIYIDLESFIFFGKMSDIFGAKKETISVSYLTEFTLRLARTLFPRSYCYFLQKFHSQEVGKALVRICMVQLLEF